MAAIASLRYFLLISHLYKIAVLKQFLNLLLRQMQHVARCLLELSLFIAVDVRPVALGEAVSENRARAPAEKDDRSVPARLALPRPCDPLVDDLPAEIGIDPSFFSARLPRLPERRRRSFASGQTARTISS